MGAVYPSSIILSAYLSSAWVDISDYQFGRMSVKYGITKNGPIDFLADSGIFTFNLRNTDSRFSPIIGSYPDWKKGCKVKLEVSFDGDTRTFYGYVDTIVPNSDVERETKTVKVTAVDWMDKSAKYPLDYPDILLEKTADQAVQAILDEMPIQPLEQSLAVGVTTFPVIFDTVTDFTKARTEFSKVLLSELCYMYVRHSGSLGEKLILENRNSRVSPVQKTIPQYSVTAGFLLMEIGDLLLLETGDNIILDLASLVSITDEDAYKFQISYGDNVINDIRFRYIPKRYSTIYPQLAYKSEFQDNILDASDPLVILKLDIGETKEISSDWKSFNHLRGNIGSSIGSIFKNAGDNVTCKVMQPFPTTINSASQMLDTNTFGAAGDVDAVVVNSFVCFMDRFLISITNNQAHVVYVELYITMEIGSALIVCEPDKLSTILQDTTSITENDFQPLQWDMPYQITSTVGDTFAAAVLAAEKDPRAVLNKINFNANYGPGYMIIFMATDIGDYFLVASADGLIDAYYFIQNYSFDIDPGGIINVSIGVKEE